MTHIVEERQRYLPQLKQALIDYVSRVEELTMTSEELVDLDVYKQTYHPKIFRFWKIELSEEQNLVNELYKQKVYQDNMILREIENADDVLVKLSLAIDEYRSQVEDKRVYNAAKGIREATHMAYSYVAYNRLWRYHFSAASFETKFHFKTERKMIDRLRELQNGTKRIDELLEGAEDELEHAQ